MVIKSRLKKQQMLEATKYEHIFSLFCRVENLTIFWYCIFSDNYIKTKVYDVFILLLRKEQFRDLYFISMNELPIYIVYYIGKVDNNNNVYIVLDILKSKSYLFIFFFNCTKL